MYTLGLVYPLLLGKKLTLIENRLCFFYISKFEKCFITTLLFPPCGFTHVAVFLFSLCFTIIHGFYAYFLENCTKGAFLEGKH